MDTNNSTSYSESANPTEGDIQDIVRRVSDSVSVMIENQLKTKS